MLRKIDSITNIFHIMNSCNQFKPAANAVKNVLGYGHFQRSIGRFLPLVSYALPQFLQKKKHPLKMSKKKKNLEKNRYHRKTGIYRVLNAAMKLSLLEPVAPDLEVRFPVYIQQVPLDFWSHLTLFAVCLIARSIFYIHLNMQSNDNDISNWSMLHSRNGMYFFKLKFTFFL